MFENQELGNKQNLYVTLVLYSRTFRVVMFILGGVLGDYFFFYILLLNLSSFA